MLFILKIVLFLRAQILITYESKYNKENGKF
jgi:hypothetical protein